MTKKSSPVPSDLCYSSYQPTSLAQNDNVGEGGKLRQPIVPLPLSPPSLRMQRVEC